MNIKVYQIESVINSLNRLRVSRQPVYGFFKQNKKKRKFDRDNFAYERAIEMLKDYEILLTVAEHRLIPSLLYAQTYISYVHKRNAQLHNEADGTPSTSNTINTAYRKLHKIIYDENFPLAQTKQLNITSKKDN